MSLWSIICKFCSTRQRKHGNVPHNRMSVLSCISLCQGIFEQMIGFYAIRGCHVASVVTPCPTQRSHLLEAVQWHRSSWQTLGGAKITPCHTKAKFRMILVSFLHERVSSLRWLWWHKGDENGRVCLEVQGCIVLLAGNKPYSVLSHKKHNLGIIIQQSGEEWGIIGNYELYFYCTKMRLLHNSKFCM